MNTISNERLESLQRQFKEEGFNDISDSEIMKLVEESLALRKERERAEPVHDQDMCDHEVFEKGASACLVDIPKDAAEIICRGISAATGHMIDWHYVGGRVHIKALRTAPPAPPVADESLPYDPQIAEYEQMMEAEQAQADTTSQQFESLAGKAVGAWIPCSERMPEDEEAVLIFTCGYRQTAYFDTDIEMWGWGEEKWHPCDVTHWQPLPEPPCK